MKSEVFLLDCMEGMKQYPDKYFDLAVVDPPYGIGDFNASPESRKIHNGKVTWNDNIPTQEYFNELYRVSKHRIIWGFNYYGGYIKDLGVIVHDKTGGGKKPTTQSYSECDIASHSFGVNMKIFHYIWQGNVQGNKINWDNSGIDSRVHPCQKPVALYDWIYAKYLPQGGKVLDTHLGSGSNRIAADKAGNIEFTAFEIDKDYFEAQEERFRLYKSQLNIFQPCT